MDQKQDPGEYHSLRLAGRWERLAAQFIDTFLVLIFIIPIMFLTGSMDQLIAGEQLDRLQMLQLVMGNYIIFFGLNGYLLFKQGQTIGKRLVKVQIVDTSGELPEIGRLIVMRYLLFGLLGSIPGIGSIAGLVDILFIFREDRRCLHDLAAGTWVIDVGE